MLNNVSQYIHEKLYFTHCTGSSMYICPNPLERSADIFVRTIETGVYTFNLWHNVTVSIFFGSCTVSLLFPKCNNPRRQKTPNVTRHWPDRCRSSGNLWILSTWLPLYYNIIGHSLVMGKRIKFDADFRPRSGFITSAAYLRNKTSEYMSKWTTKSHREYPNKTETMQHVVSEHHVRHTRL